VELHFCQSRAMGEAVPQNLCDGNAKGDSERSAGLAENGFCVLVAQASGGAESDAIARRSLLLKRRIESASVSTLGEMNFESEKSRGHRPLARVWAGVRPSVRMLSICKVQPEKLIGGEACTWQRKLHLIRGAIYSGHICQAEPCCILPKCWTSLQYKTHRIVGWPTDSDLFVESRLDV